MKIKFVNVGLGQLFYPPSRELESAEDDDYKCLICGGISPSEEMLIVHEFNDDKVEHLIVHEPCTEIIKKWTICDCPNPELPKPEPKEEFEELDEEEQIFDVGMLKDEL